YCPPSRARSRARTATRRRGRSPRGLALRSFEHPKGFGEKIVAAEVAGLQREMQAEPVDPRMAPRHARIDLRTDLQLRDAQRLHAGTGRLATGNDELPDAQPHEAARDFR